MPKELPDLAVWIRSVRLRLDKTQDEMAVLLDVSLNTYGKWERGERLSPRDHKPMARLVKMSPPDLQQAYPLRTDPDRPAPAAAVSGVPASVPHQDFAVLMGVTLERELASLPAALSDPERRSLVAAVEARRGSPASAEAAQALVRGIVAGFLVHKSGISR